MSEELEAKVAELIGSLIEAAEKISGLEDENKALASEVKASAKESAKAKNLKGKLDEKKEELKGVKKEANGLKKRVKNLKGKLDDAKAEADSHVCESGSLSDEDKDFLIKLHGKLGKLFWNHGKAGQVTLNGLADIIGQLPLS